MKMIMNNTTYSVVKNAVKQSAFLFIAVCFFTLNSCKNKNGVKTFQTTTESQWNGQTITGTVKNLSNNRISFISVEFELINDRYMVLQTVSATGNEGIEPNGKWDFEIQASAIGARSMRLKNTIAK
jgi:hypothetical protein